MSCVMTEKWEIEGIMKRQRKAILLVLVCALFFSACGDKKTNESSALSVGFVEATAMRLARTVGTVLLKDEDGTDIPTQENMRLYSGNSIDTDTDSRAGIELDEVKAVTVGAESLAQLYQNGKNLAMTLARGEMYFGVAKPLEDDESFRISTSTMTMGIRGTSGYVAAVSEEKTAVILTSGSVILSAFSGETQLLEAGQRAVITVKDGSTEIEVSPVSPDDYPALLLEELSIDSRILDEASEQNGGDYRSYIQAMRQYRTIIAQAADYDYNLEAFGALLAPAPNGNYQYALELINSSDTVPTLLLRQETQNSHDYVRLFRYDPDIGGIIAPTGILGSSRESVVAFSVNKAENGNGLIFYVNNSGNGRYYDLYRLTAAGQSMSLSNEWSGDITESIPTELRYHAVQWQNIQEAGSLSRLTMPTDGNRIVLTGTINTYSYQEAVELQGIADWNATDPNSTYRIIVLDMAQMLRGHHVDAYSEGEARMILYTGNEIPLEYDGQHIIFSLDPETIWWPSDTRIPVGQPGTSDVHILD